MNPDIEDFDVVSPGGTGEEGEAGNLAASFIAVNMQGETFTSIDLGEPFMLVDASTGKPDSYKWSVSGIDASGNAVDAVIADNADNRTLPLYCPVDGVYDVTLEVARSNDGSTSTVTLEDYLTIDWIPVTADFFTDKTEENGVINIKHGDVVVFTDNSKGLPDEWFWFAPGGTPMVKTTQTDTVQYLKPGQYDVIFKSTRTIDGEQNEIKRTKYVNVVERILYLVRATATDDVVVLEYNEPLRDNTDDLIDDLYIQYITAAGATIVPDIESVTLIDEYHIEVKLDQYSYSDDKVYVYMESGNLYDATGLVEAPEVDAELCVYGHNLFENSDFEDMSHWKESVPGSTWELVSSNPEPVQGNKCMKMDKDVESVGFIFDQPIPFAEGTVYKLAMEMRSEGASGGIEMTRFFGTPQNQKLPTAGAGSLSCGGGWMNATGISSSSWQTIERTIEEYVGPAQDLYYNILFYGSGIVYVDNVRLYIDNPRP